MVKVQKEEQIMYELYLSQRVLMILPFHVFLPVLYTFFLYYLVVCSIPTLCIQLSHLSCYGILFVCCSANKNYAEKKKKW